MPSIFSRIISGELPSIKVHEDDRTLAIMDIHPIQIGQILVLPKQEVATIWDLSDEDYLALMQTVHQAGMKLKEVFPEKLRVGMIVEGIEVKDHAHVKVFPFSSAEEFHHQPSEDDVLPESELKALGERLAF